MAKIDIYEMVNQKIMEKLEAGVVPWRHYCVGSTADRQLPINGITNKHYRGVNVWLLQMLQTQSNRWGSYKQWSDHGKQVRKGETGTYVVFWRIWEKESAEGVKEKLPLLRYSVVFNEAQLEGFQPSLPDSEVTEVTPIEKAEKLISSFPLGFPKPKICDEGRAFYRPQTDEIYLPEINSFVSGERYYNTLFHESIHATGHKSRLNRLGWGDDMFHGSESYSKEELTAELGASYLSAYCSIFDKTGDTSASYISSWLSRIRNDKKFLIQSSAQAQKAIDFLLGTKFEVE